MEHVVVYEVAGLVNNVPVEIAGRGTLTQAGLRVSQIVRRESLHWDAMLTALHLDALLALGLRAIQFPQPGVPEPIRFWASLLDENGREMGRAVCSGSLALENGTLRLRAQFLEATCRMELGERITRIVAPFPMSVLPADSHVLLTSVWSFETSRGNLYRGSTMTIAGLAGEGCAAGVLAVNEVLIERGRDTETIRLTFGQ